jgi:hypothetical protein
MPVRVAGRAVGTLSATEPTAGDGMTNESSSRWWALVTVLALAALLTLVIYVNR